ncbi:MAG: hypothetical protein ACLS8R_07405 [Anaeromassilibacillus sp.]
MIGIAIGLSMDAFAVSITNGAVTRNVTFGFATKLAASFGLFQAAMPMIGWAVGKAGEGLSVRLTIGLPCSFWSSHRYPNASGSEKEAQ